MLGGKQKHFSREGTQRCWETEDMSSQGEKNKGLPAMVNETLRDTDMGEAFIFQSQPIRLLEITRVI